MRWKASWNRNYQRRGLEFSAEPSVDHGTTTLVASETAFTGNCNIWICVHPRTQHKGSLWQLRNGFDSQGLSSAQWSSFFFFLDYKSCGVKCLMQSLGAYWSCASDLSIVRLHPRVDPSLGKVPFIDQQLACPSLTNSWPALH